MRAIITVILVFMLLTLPLSAIDRGIFLNWWAGQGILLSPINLEGDEAYLDYLSLLFSLGTGWYSKIIGNFGLYTEIMYAPLIPASAFEVGNPNNWPSLLHYCKIGLGAGYFDEYFSFQWTPNIITLNNSIGFNSTFDGKLMISFDGMGISANIGVDTPSIHFKDTDTFKAPFTMRVGLGIVYDYTYKAKIQQEEEEIRLREAESARLLEQARNQQLLMDLAILEQERLVNLENIWQMEQAKKEFQTIVLYNKSRFENNWYYSAELINSIINTKIDEVKLLLENGVNPNGLGNKNSISPLGLACSNGSLELVNLLLQYGADPNFIPDGQLSPLGYSIFGAEKTDIVRSLILAGLDVNHKSSNTNPDIFNAVLLGQANVLKLLIDAGADINQQNKEGKTLIEVAQEVGWRNCYELLTIGKIISDMTELVEIGTKKLVINLLTITNNTDFEPFWLNEVIAVPRGMLVILESNSTLWKTTRYLVAINDTSNNFHAFYIDSPTPFETIRSGNQTLLFEDIKIRKIGFSQYYRNGVLKETFLFTSKY